MSTGRQRRSLRIREIDARRAKDPNKGKRLWELDMEDLDIEEYDFNRNNRKKKIMSISIQDLGVGKVGDKAPEVGNSSHEDHQPNAAVMSSESSFSERSKLELLLDALKRRDWYDIFSEPVKGDVVEKYYEIIKNPMDFGTIAKKLGGGSYKTPAEFEDDVFLVFDNAMDFNASSTIYHRQASALNELAKKLFDALKTDLEKFEKECSAVKSRASRRMNHGSGGKSTNWPESGGPRENEEDRRGAYKPWEKFLSENESIISSVYKSPKPVNLILKTKMDDVRYEESLARFVKHLGPKPLAVAKEKLQKQKIDGALKHVMKTARLEPQTRNYEIPNVASGPRGFPAAASLDYDKNYQRSQNFSGKRVCGSALGTLNIEDTLCRGFFQFGNIMEHTGAGGIALQGTGEGGLSFKQCVADQGVDTPCISTICNNPNSNSTNLISYPTGKGKSVLLGEVTPFLMENPGNFNRNSVPPMREGYNSLKDNSSYDDIVKCLSPAPLGDSFSYLSTTMGRCSNGDKFISSYINMAKNSQIAEATSSLLMQNPADQHRNSFQSMKQEGIAFKQNLPDQGIEKSLLYRALFGAGGSSSSGTENMLYNWKVQMPVANYASLLESPGDNLGKSVESMNRDGAVFKELMPNQGSGSAYFSTPMHLDGSSYFPVQLNGTSNPGMFTPTGINNGAMNVQVPGMTSSGPNMLDTLFASDHGIQLSATLDPHFPTVTAGLDLTSHIGGANQIQAVGAGGGTSYQDMLEQAGQISSWLQQPAQWVPQSIYNFPMQDLSITGKAGLAGQAASPEWRVPVTNAGYVQVSTNAGAMNGWHSTNHRQDELKTGTPLDNN